MKRAAVIALCVCIALLGFHCGRKCAEMPRFGDVVVQVDTLLVRDTFVAVAPSVAHIETIGVADVVVTDTSRLDGELVAHVPIERKVYETARFRAEVTGYMPSLDRLEIYGENRQVTRTIRASARRNTFAIGVEPMWAGGFHVPVMADYSRAVLPWLDVGAGVGYDPIDRIPVMRASACVRFSW